MSGATRTAPSSRTRVVGYVRCLQTNSTWGQRRSARHWRGGASRTAPSWSLFTRTLAFRVALSWRSGLAYSQRSTRSEHTSRPGC